MKLDLRLPYFVHPEKPIAGAPLLLFLHGVGEAYDDNGKVAHENLFKQGPPKYLRTLREALPQGHPLFELNLIAPQLPDRGTPWSGVVGDLQEILHRERVEETKLCLMGFSKGGLGAFQVARQIRPSALVSIDASPMGQAPGVAAREWVSPLEGQPFWAIYTGYPMGDGFRKIQDFNELLTQREHAGISAAPQPGGQWRTLLNAPQDRDTSVKRHVWVSDEVSASVAPYRWLLRH